MSTELRAQIDNLETHLRRYLPASLAAPLIKAPSLVTARPCDVHLDALLHAVSTYLPRYLVADLMQDPQPGQVSGRFRDTTIMFADISGFTAMSERLSRRGEQGAETIANIVGDYFTAMLDITARHGGDLLKFGGDALLVAFFDRGHAIRACRAAAEMQRAIARFRQVEAFGETFRLKMTVGLGSGPLFTANLGTVDKMEYTVMGEALSRMAHAEDQAEGGEIFVDETTYRAVRQHVRVGETRDGCTLITDVEDGDIPDAQAVDLEALIHPDSQADAPGNTIAAMSAHLAGNVTRLDALVPFLPPGLLDRVKFDPAGMASRARGEFRPVTVIFANFYGIDEIIQQLGASRSAEITAILNAHFSRMQEVIDHYEGMIDKVDSYVVGHRIMALFGAPRAHVDDPERAVRAAWEMQAAMVAFRQLETSVGIFTLKQRIGINTGRVFAGNVGSDMRHEYSVMGDEVNLTARLMSVAREGQVLISQSTAAEAGARFRLKEQAPVSVKGKSQPVTSYAVQGTHERAARSDTRRGPLVGRNDEWARIWHTAQQALAGAPQVLDIHGEMGMGKSRLLETLVEHWTDVGGHTYLAACLSYGRHTPYAPWVDLLRQSFDLREGDTGPDRGARIERHLAARVPEWTGWGALIGQILGIPVPESDLIRSLDPKLRQQNLQRLVADLIAAESAQRPILLVVDDIQWIDEVSRVLLDHVTAHLQPVPVLVCAAYRPEAHVRTLQAQGLLTTVTLDALSEAGSMALLDSQLPTEPEMPRRLKEVILKNAQGNPLFIVEMAHALIENYLVYDLEAGVFRPRTDLDRVQVPDTVSRVILSRLDRLDEQSRNLLKVASVIGRTFQQWLLRSVYPYQTDEIEIETHLLDMCENDLLDRSEIMYLFRHVMTREVAYESLLYADRRDIHYKIARSVEAQQDAQGDEYVEVLAEHYTLAEQWPEALRCQMQAARRAQSVYANEDAIHRYRTAIEVAAQVPGSTQQQLSAHEGLGDTYQLVGQYDEALVSYEAARGLLDASGHSPNDGRRHRAALCRKTGRVCEYRGEYEAALDWVRLGLDLLDGSEDIETARLRLGGAAVFQREGKWPAAIEWAHLSREIAEQLDTPEARQTAAHADYLLGNGYRRLGETDQAGLCLQRSLDTYREIEDQPGMARAYNNLANFYRYQPDWKQASDYYQNALAILERIGDMYGQAVIANNLAEVLLDRGQLDEARAHYQRSLDIAQELGNSGLIALLHNNLGHTAVRARDWAQALRELERSLEMFQKLGAEEFLPELYRHLAQAHLGAGDPDRALDYAQMSIEHALVSQTRLEEGCARRVLGSIYRAQGEPDQARVELERSLSILADVDSPYQVARTGIELAAVCIDQGTPSQAGRLRREAIATFERLGAELDLSRAKEDRR